MIGRMAMEIVMDAGVIRSQGILNPETVELGRQLKMAVQKRKSVYMQFLQRLVCDADVQHPHLLMHLMVHKQVWGLV